MRKQQQAKIICPNCGAEYLPCEIYLPNHFLGKSYFIEKDYLGKILDYYGQQQNLIEQYTCDKCNKTFTVRGQLNFYTSIIDNLSFNDSYTTKYKSNKLKLSED